MKRKNFPERKNQRRRRALENLETALNRREATGGKSEDNKSSMTELRRAILHTNLNLTPSDRIYA